MRHKSRLPTRRICLVVCFRKQRWSYVNPYASFDDVLTTALTKLHLALIDLVIPPRLSLRTHSKTEMNW